MSNSGVCFLCRCDIVRDDSRMERACELPAIGNDAQTVALEFRCPCAEGSLIRGTCVSLRRDPGTNQMMAPRTEATVRKAAAPDIEVALICADRDGNRIRIDAVDHGTGTISYHFLNDELRVQEGVQKRPIKQFLAEGWYVAAAGKSL